MDFKNIDWMQILGVTVKAVLIILATWLIAMLVKKAVAALANKVDVLRRPDASGQPIGESLGSIGSLLVWLVGLIALLEVLNFSSALTPVEGMLSTIFAFLPRLLGAAIVFYVGYMIAKVVRELFTTSLNAAGFDQKVAKWTGKSTTPNAQAGAASQNDTSITSILGTVVFGIIVALVGIAALEILGINALTEPARSVVDTIFAAIPAILLAAVLLTLGVVIANFVAKIAQPALAATGVDKAADDAGIKLGSSKVSGTLALIIKIAIILFFAVMAAQALNFPAVTEILNEVLALGGKVLFGGVIIAAGFFVASLIKRIIGENTAGTIVYWVTVVLFVAMGLKFMGIADSIINMAFGAIVIGGALAAALAFGIGGKDAAARLLEKAEKNVDNKDADRL